MLLLPFLLLLLLLLLVMALVIFLMLLLLPFFVVAAAIVVVGSGVGNFINVVFNLGVSIVYFTKNVFGQFFNFIFIN
jgi:hypothetical protein